MPIHAPQKETWPCPSTYHVSQKMVEVNRDGSLRKHTLDGRTCPGSGFNIRKPSGVEQDALAARESAHAR